MDASSTSLLNDPTPGIVDNSDFNYWREHFGETLAVSGLLGDYNGDDVVNAADYSVWRDAMAASSTTLLNDPTPGTVDESDFSYWRAHFGETLGSGSGTSSAAVPEPTSLALLLSLAALPAVCRRGLGLATRLVPCAASLRCASSWRK